MAVNKVVYNGNTLIDLTNDSVASDKMLSGTTAHDKAGNPVSGSIANNGAMNKTMDGVNTKSVTVPAGYTSGGTVSMDSTVDNAVTEALAALTEKGVTVPEGTNVTGLADLIAAIEAGGGGGRIETGTLTLSETVNSPTTNPLTIEHSLGVAPTFFIVWNEEKFTTTKQYPYIYGIVHYGTITTVIFRASSSGFYQNAASYPDYASPVLEADKFGVSVNYASSISVRFGPHLTWIAGVL